MSRPSAVIKLDMVFLVGGTFVMGSDGGQEDESPPHTVELSPYYIGRYSVTNREYRAFIDCTVKEPLPAWNDPNFNDPSQPVVAVNWFEAMAYCAWLSELLGERFRLPTEAEREHACRAGTTTAYPWGDSVERNCTGYGRRWHEGAPEVVGGPQNSFGLCNMADNVHEWCSDWYSRDYYRVSPRKNPPGPASGVRRASRGGSWRHHVKLTRSSARSSLNPAFRYTDYGFRIARSA
ncbi:MAG TPA: SUMF1/EgtB/PvdO family nonheme iron enzyme [Acidobacteriota bacterium]|nr:SUMF1/EgtB/PvdO family nonheme iron enzyme [Acidobacteriota bacterium]